MVMKTRPNLRTVVVAIVAIVAAVSIVLKTWLPIVVLMSLPLFALIVGGLFASFLNKKDTNIYIMPQKSGNKLISDDRFDKEKEKDTLH